MVVSFDEIAPRARVWVYQADRSLRIPEQQVVEDELGHFLQQWTAHGKDLKAAGRVFHSQFLVIAVDETAATASGCSIDASVAFVKELEKALQVSFFDRTKVAILEGEEVHLKPLHEVREEVKAGRISPDTLTFNNLVQSKEELDEKWIVPAKNSWLSKYF